MLHDVVRDLANARRLVLQTRGRAQVYVLLQAKTAKYENLAEDHPKEDAREQGPDGARAQPSREKRRTTSIVIARDDRPTRAHVALPGHCPLKRFEPATYFLHCSNESNTSPAVVLPPRVTQKGRR